MMTVHRLNLTLFSSITNLTNEWFIDSGATKHMRFDRSILFEFVKYKHPLKIFLGDSTFVLAQGKGKVRLPKCDGSDDAYIALHKVLLVPKLTKNLLSVPAMAQMGAEVCFDKEKCVVIKDGKKITVGNVLAGKLYRVTAPEFSHHSTASNAPSLKIWHERLGHLNLDYVNQLTKKNLVTGMRIDDSVSSEKICESCVIGKMHKQCFPKVSQHRATQPMELIHTDLCGPMQVESMGGSRYVLMFTDDLSRYTTAYFLKNKDETLFKFKEFVNLVENQTGCQVSKLNVFAEKGKENIKVI